MAKPFRPKRGTTAQNNAFTGLEHEITLDKDKGSLRVHDGVTAGGAHEILPKDKNDALYAPKDIDVGVTSVNGKTGVVTLDVGVTSVNGQSGAVTITPPDPYVLPAATGSTLGGVKIGSNISNSSGTISLSKANVTGALGYTPLQTAPVTSVNGMTGAVTISTGGTSAYKIPYATCSTATTTAAKVATINNSVGFSLVSGAIVIVKFSNFTYNVLDQGPTLNVNSTGAKTIKWTTVSLGTTQRAYFFPANNVFAFVYDGTYWNAVSTSGFAAGD